jgi:uncharacterized protein YgiB involved in biofilm formation
MIIGSDVALLSWRKSAIIQLNLWKDILMNRILTVAVLAASGLFAACEKSDTDAALETAKDVASDTAEATKDIAHDVTQTTKEATGEAMEYTGDKVREAGEAMSETGKSMQTPE